MRFLDPELIRDPYPAYANWLANHPIWHDEETNSWVMTRHDDIRSVLKNSAAYSSDAMGQGASVPLPLLTDDPPKHTQLRGLVDRAFTARMLKGIEPRITELAVAMVDNLSVDEPVDIVQELTIPLPVAVISQMLGIPAERGEDFKRWSDALTGTLTGVSPEDRMADIMQMSEFFASLIPERRANPGEDLLSAIANAEIDGQRLTDQEIVGFSILLLIAGNETTTNLLGNFLNVLADRSDIYQRLVRDPSLLPAAIEETLRFDAPVQFLFRKALRPLEYHGQPVAPGEVVTVVTAAANRDPLAYELPDEFNLDRRKNHHHAFGFGIHFCIGAPLARLEAREVMRALVARFGTLQRAPGDDERLPSFLLRGFHHLWLSFAEGQAR